MNTSDTKTVEIRVGENTSGFVMELWTELPNILSISLTSPSGESTSRIPIRAGTSTTFNFLFENTTVYIDYPSVCRKYSLGTDSFSFFPMLLPESGSLW